MEIFWYFYMQFYEVIEMTTHSQSNISQMSVHKNALQSGLQKLLNYTISGFHDRAVFCFNTFSSSECW